MSIAEPPAEAKPRLLFFYSPTAGASVRIDGYLAQVLQRRRNHETFLVHRIDVDQRPDLAERFRVSKTPALFVLDGKRIAAKVEKPRSSKQLQELLQPWLR